MKHRSEMRDRRLWEARQRGLSYYEYYAEVWERWCRRYGPDVVAPPKGKYGYFDAGVGSQTMGGRLLYTASKDTHKAAQRIAETIAHERTESAYWSEISQAEKGLFKVYIRGKKYIFSDAAKTRLFLEMFFAYQILAPDACLNDFRTHMAEIVNKSEKHKFLGEPA